MEYEIRDEEALFDASTNPSLLHDRSGRGASRTGPRKAQEERSKRPTRRAETIPEEELETQMG
ncbi:MAG: hypothetical protein ABIP41_03715 [Croceibacterium sp.]